MPFFVVTRKAQQNTLQISWGRCDVSQTTRKIFEYKQVTFRISCFILILVLRMWTITQGCKENCTILLRNAKRQASVLICSYIQPNAGMSFNLFLSFREKDTLYILVLIPFERILFSLEQCSMYFLEFRKAKLCGDLGLHQFRIIRCMLETFKWRYFKLEFASQIQYSSFTSDFKEKRLLRRETDSNQTLV